MDFFFINTVWKYSIPVLYFQYNHYFETTYGSGYHTVDTSKVPEVLKHLEGESKLDANYFH